MRITTAFLAVTIVLVYRGTKGVATKAPFGDVRNCPTKSPLNPTQPLYQMEVLPGIGHDNLHSTDMGQVLNYNYSLCQISKDGKFLLPDGVFLIPVQQSSIDTSAEYFDHWDNYTSAISFSLGVHGGINRLLSAKFSAGYTHAKSHMYNQHSKMTRAQIRYWLYMIKMQPDAQIHPVFKARLFDIAAYLQNNDYKHARYLSEVIIRDFGTHCITSMEAGALIMQTTFVRSSYTQESSSNSFSIALSASGVLNSAINLGAKFSFSINQSQINSFVSNRVHSNLLTIGGPPYQSNFTLSEWEGGVANSLVAIDRSGVPLHFIINQNTLPELPPLTVQMLSNIVYEAIERYYRVNTRHGCTDPTAKNFDFQANIDNGNCNYPSDNYTFGGLYQNCKMDSTSKYEDLCMHGPQMYQPNPLTGDLSCPMNYYPVNLHSGTAVRVTNHVGHQVCHRLWYTLWIKKKCRTVYGPQYSKAYFNSYWCAAQTGTQIPNKSGYLFGGLYTSKNSNPVTQTKGCPRFFIPLHMGEDIRVCVSDDYERAYARSIPFAGFHSCESGNPLAVGNVSRNAWPHECPIGYTQHLVSIENGCEINYCVQVGAFSSQSLLPAHLPPFHKQPKQELNASEPMVLVGANGGLWAKNSDGQWVNYVEPSTFSINHWFSLDSTVNDTNPTVQTLKGGPSTTTVAAVSITGTLVLGALIAVAVFVGHCAYKKARGKKHSKYMDIEEQQGHLHNLTSEAA